MIARTFLTATVLALLTVFPVAEIAATPSVAHAADPQAVPPFRLPELFEGVEAESAALFSASERTVLVLLRRGCPHCLEIALETDDFAPLLVERDARAIVVFCGPDDPVSLRTMLQAEGFSAPSYWDASGRLAARLGMGEDHLRVFVIDRWGAVLAAWDDSIDDLPGTILPALDAWEGQASPRADRTNVFPDPLEAPVLRIDGRMRFQSTEGASPGQTGLYGERLDNGSLALFRWDLRAAWDLGRGMEIEPRLRIGNEPDAALTEGAEQLAERYGTLSLRWRGRWASATAGAHEARLTPLLLWRWDADDAPPLGGIAGCAVCAGGVVGVLQRSLEVLDAPYTFEGARFDAAHRLARFAVSGAVARWERSFPRWSGASVEDSLSARYRRGMVSARIDVGPAGREDPVSGLPSPIGARIAYLAVEDDRRTVDPARIRPPLEWDERGWAALLHAGPWLGIAAEAERVWWRVQETRGEIVWDEGYVERYESSGRDRWAHRIGLRGSWSGERLGGWARIHHIRTEPGFEPLYAALTYRENETGWRAAAGLRLLDGSSSGEERLGLSGFVRAVEEVEPRLPGWDRVSRTVWNVSVTGAPAPAWRTGLHVVRVEEDSPTPALPGTSSTGISFDARWSGASGVEPLVRIDVVRRDDGWNDPWTYREAVAAVRVTR